MKLKIFLLNKRFYFSTDFQTLTEHFPKVYDEAL